MLSGKPICLACEEQGGMTDNKYVQVGGELTMSCPFENYDSFKWKFNDKEILNSSHIIAIQNITSAYAGK